MKRANVIFRVVLVLIGLMTFAQPAIAKTDSCALLKTEADTLLAQALQANPADAQRLKDAAQFYITPCAKPFLDDSLVSIWKYDAANPNELARWMQFGSLPSKGWAVVGQGNDAYFQGTTANIPPSSDLGALIRLNGFAVNNLVTYTYQGNDYPMYIVAIDNKTRVLPLIKKLRRSATFLDPLSGQPLEWQGNWQTLEAVTSPYIAVDVSVRVRLDTPQSLFKSVIGITKDAYIAVQISQDGVLVQNTIGNQSQSQATQSSSVTPTLTPTSTAGPIPEIGKWYSLRLLVLSNRLQAYLDQTQIADIELDNFVMPDRILPGFLTSADPATISLNDLEVKTNFSSSK